MSWPPTAEEIRAALRGTTPAVVTDAELEDYASTAVASVEERIGPRSGQTFKTVMTITTCGDVVALGHKAAAVQSVTVNDAPTPYTFDPTESPWLVRGPFAAGRVVVTATAPDTVSGKVDRATIRLAAFLARQDKITSARPGAAAAEDTPQGFAWPRAVLELLGKELEAGGTS